MARDWLADRNELERRWATWRKTIRYRGLTLVADIPLDANWVGIERRFPISFHDRVKGSFDVPVRKPLIHLTEREVRGWVRKSLPKLPIGDCARCGQTAILQKLQNRPGLCRACVLKSIDESSKEEAARQKTAWNERATAYKAKGYRFVLEVWIHPRRGGSDYHLEFPFKVRPTAAAARRIAVRNGSALVDDFAVRSL